MYWSLHFIITVLRFPGFLVSDIIIGSCIFISLTICITEEFSVFTLTKNYKYILIQIKRYAESWEKTDEYPDITGHLYHLLSKAQGLYMIKEWQDYKKNLEEKTRYGMPNCGHGIAIIIMNI